MIRVSHQPCVSPATNVDFVQRPIFVIGLFLTQNLSRPSPALMKTNPVKKKLKAGQPLFGTWLSLGDLYAAQ